MKKQIYTIEIEFTPGSEFQGEIFKEHLKAILTALNIYFSTNHKKNKIEIKWEEKEAIQSVKS